MRPVLEHIPASDSQSFHLGHYHSPHFDAPWHYHPEWELTYIISGSGTAYAGNAVRHFVAGELCLIGANLPHCWKNTSQEASEVKSVFVQWDYSLLGDGWLDGNEFTAIKNLLQQSQNGLVFDSQLSTGLGDTLLSLSSLPPLGRLLAFIELLQQLCDTPYQELSLQQTYQVNHLASRRIERILSHVEQHYQGKISADDMAELSSMTKVSFSKYFKRTFHKPFTQFLNEYRVSQACSLLIEGEEPIEEVAHRCGYQNMAFFHRQFKLQMAMTPLSYRQLYRSAASKPQ